MDGQQGDGLRGGAERWAAMWRREMMETDELYELTQLDEQMQALLREKLGEEGFELLRMAVSLEMLPLEFQAKALSRSNDLLRRYHPLFSKPSTKEVDSPTKGISHNFKIGEKVRIANCNDWRNHMNGMEAVITNVFAYDCEAMVYDTRELFLFQPYELEREEGEPQIQPSRLCLTCSYDGHDPDHTAPESCIRWMKEQLMEAKQTLHRLNLEKGELDAGLETCELELNELKRKHSDAVLLCKELDHYGEALIACQYNAGSPLVREMVKKAQRIIEKEGKTIGTFI
jgi:hypothetical protein